MQPNNIVSKTLTAGLAVLFTGVVFLGMRFLIIPSGDGPAQVDQPPIVDITRTEREEESKAKERVKPKRPEPKKLPPIQKLVSRSLSIADKNLPGGIGVPAVFEKPGSNGPIVSDRHATPLVRIPPQYPMRAADSGVEGWVMVEFTINLAGGVEDAAIIDAEPKGTFDRSVLKAIQRWKYQPKMVDGKPVAQYNMRELVSFKMEQ